MAILNIRNLPDEVHAKLRLRAAAAGRSMEAEARQILTEVVLTSRPAELAPQALQQWIQQLYADQERAMPKNAVDDLLNERRAEAAAES